MQKNSHLQEIAMDGEGIGEFGMEAASEEVTLPKQYGIFSMAGEDVNLGGAFDHPRSADEASIDHFLIPQGDGRLEGIDLSAIGVALDGDVDGAEGALIASLDAFGEQNHSRTGAENGFRLNKRLQTDAEVGIREVVEHGGGLSSGNDEGGARGKIFCGTDEF